tara:strand:- start:358 stop:810 length:453 start_codon:yes stop_codon:yes gene_type:complete
MEELDNNLEEAQTEDTDASGPKGLRDENKRLKEELKEYKSAALESTVNSLGLDPVVAKAVTKLYDGKPNADSVKAFVNEEFGDVLGQVQPAEQTKEEFTDASARVDKLATSQVSNNPQSLDQQIQEVISTGTVRESIAAKLYAMENQNKQ